MNKIPDLTAILEADRPDLVAITETFLSDEIGDSELVDSPYCVFRRDRSRHGGGVLLLIRDIIPAIRRDDLENECELLWVEISHVKNKTFLGVFYNPPASGLDCLYNHLNSLAKIHDSCSVVHNPFHMDKISSNQKKKYAPRCTLQIFGTHHHRITTYTIGRTGGGRGSLGC